MRRAAWLSLALLAGCDSDPDLQPESDLSLRWKVDWDTTGVATTGRQDQSRKSEGGRGSRQN